MKITRILAYRVELPLHERHLQVVRRQIRHRLRQHDRRASKPTPGSSATAKSARSGPFYLPAYADGVRAGLRELGPHLIGDDPRELGKLNRRDGRRAQGPSLRQERASTSPAGTSSARRPGCRCASCSADATATTSTSIAPSRRTRPTRWRRSVAGYRAEGYRRFQLKVGGDPDVDIERIHAVARDAPARRSPRRRRQHRLDAARGHARRPRPCATSTSTSSSPA